MATEPNKSSEPPAPEVLKPKAETSQQAPEPSAAAASDKPKEHVRPRHVTYRPSHKATFIGLAVVIGVLAVNVGVVAFLMRDQGDAEENAQREEVTISSESLGKLGVSRNPVGNLGTELVVGPDSRFNGGVTIGGNVDIARQLTLNSKFSASGARLSSLEAGKTSVSEININGDATATNLALRQDLSVAGTSQLQGNVNVGRNLNVAGNLAVGGTLSAGKFQLDVLELKGRIVSRGSPPSVARGPDIGSNGTVSISGNDTAGTVAVNAGTGAGGGIVAQVAFRGNYGNGTPHVVITPVGRGVSGFFVTRSAGGFSIGVSGSMSPGGYAFDYIVVQ